MVFKVCLSRPLYIKTVFVIILSFAFSIALSWMYSGVFQRLHGLDADRARRIQLSSITPKISEHVKQCDSFYYIYFVLENIYKKII